MKCAPFWTLYSRISIFNRKYKYTIPSKQYLKFPSLQIYDRLQKTWNPSQTRCEEILFGAVTAENRSNRRGGSLRLPESSLPAGAVLLREPVSDPEQGPPARTLHGRGTLHGEPWPAFWHCHRSILCWREIKKTVYIAVAIELRRQYAVWIVLWGFPQQYYECHAGAHWEQAGLQYED